SAREGEALPYPRRFAVRESDRIVLVKANDLDAVEAAGNYVMLVAGSRKHLMRLTLVEMEKQLDPARFVRIHRSTIVNTDRVREIRLDPHGDCDLSMENGATYRLSRAHGVRRLSGYGGSFRWAGASRGAGSKLRSTTLPPRADGRESADRARSTTSRFSSRRAKTPRRGSARSCRCRSWSARRDTSE